MTSPLDVNTVINYGKSDHTLVSLWNDAHNNVIFTYIYHDKILRFSCQKQNFKVIVVSSDK